MAEVAAYKNRPSPPYHAQDYKGQKKTGNDGELYISIANKKGIYTWRPAPRPMHAYLIHDNGGRPFEVEDFKGHVVVHERIYQRDTEDYLRSGGKPLVKTPYERLFVGEDDGDFGLGNSVLIKVNATKYIYVGSQIYSFAPVKGDVIKSYHSPIGNSDVPYPYAIGATHTYILLDAVAVPNELLDLKADIYEQWYFVQNKRQCEQSRNKRPTPYCRALLKDKAAVTRKLSIHDRRKTLKVKKIY